MEQENRLARNRFSKPFVGLSSAQEADSRKRKRLNTCEAATEVDELVETLMRKKETKTEENSHLSYESKADELMNGVLSHFASQHQIAQEPY